MTIVSYRPRQQLVHGVDRRGDAAHDALWTRIARDHLPERFESLAKDPALLRIALHERFEHILDAVAPCSLPVSL